MSDTCLCIDLRTAAQQLTRIYDGVMAPSGITVTQFSLMHLIQRLDGPSVKELAEASQLERSTLGRNVRVLEKLGLVDMKTGEDARTRTIYLSRKWLKSLQRALPLWQSAQSQLLERLGLEGRQQLEETLKILTTPLTAPTKSKA